MKLNNIGKILCIISILMISMGVLVLSKEKSLKLEMDNREYSDANVLNTNNVQARIDTSSLDLKQMNMNAANASLIRIVVFDNLTMEELSAKLNRVIGGAMSGKGNLIATESIKRGVDPYVATAIMMHETGNGTSSMCRTCFNFGGQKGSGCGAYQRFSSTDEGLTRMIDNLYRNYYAKGLTTIESIGSRYAESNTWPSMIHKYVNKIKSS